MSLTTATVAVVGIIINIVIMFQNKFTKEGKRNGPRIDQALRKFVLKRKDCVWNDFAAVPKFFFKYKNSVGVCG